jgi:hypothetical protein
LGFKTPGAIYGVSKEELKKKGMVYLEAEPAIQEAMKKWQELSSNLKEIFAKCDDDPDVLVKILEVNRCKY